MTQPELLQKSPLVSSSKAYLRNVGKGKLKFSENTLKFYVYKGTLRKKKEFAKQIRFADVDNIILDSKELAVLSLGATERFVVEDKSFAELVYRSFNEFVSQKGNDSMKQGQKTEEQPQIISKAAPTIEAPEPAYEKPIQQKSTEKSHFSEAYLRNVGKGSLEFSQNILNFYISKGKLTKKKVLIKQIPFMEVENISLESNELAITSKGETLRFVVKDKVLAQLISENFHEFAIQKENKPLSQNEETTNANISVTANATSEENIEQTLMATFPIIDSLFDALMCLQGRVDWNRIGEFVKRSEEDIKKVRNKKLLETANLDFCLLFSAVTEHDVEKFSEEEYRLLESVYHSFQRVEHNSLAKNAIRPYFILNDVVLGFVVGDTNTENENALLTTSLADLSKETGMNVSEVVECMNRLIKEQQKNPYVEEARSAFRKQFSAVLPK